MKCVQEKIHVDRVSDDLWLQAWRQSCSAAPLSRLGRDIREHALGLRGNTWNQAWQDLRGQQ